MNSEEPLGQELESLETSEADAVDLPHPLAVASAALAAPGERAPDLIARGMSWDDTEKLMREACAQAGVQWDDDKQPQDIAVNVMQRLANAAHKAGFKLALERVAASPALKAESMVQPLASHVSTLRMLRLEHYRAYLRAKAEEDDASGYLSRETARNKANRHSGIVAALSSCFPAGDTAERDAQKGATYA